MAVIAPRVRLDLLRRGPRLVSCTPFLPRLSSPPLHAQPYPRAPSSAARRRAPRLPTGVAPTRPYIQLTTPSAAAPDPDPRSYLTVLYTLLPAPAVPDPTTSRTRTLLVSYCVKNQAARYFYFLLLAFLFLSRSLARACLPFGVLEVK
ncbi:hypothetical protein C8R45DRAFT_1115432 [Mycena sanguinolenta]|nr:hypothetical protein C8R45DRAFT_1115432 [Mycena sanguinolenta]